MSEAEDHAEIRTVVENYFYALDARRLELMSHSFASGATMVQAGNPVDLGVGAQIGENFAGIAEFAATSHLRTGQHIDLAGNTAHSHTMAQAVVVEKSGPVHVRGISYHDDLERTADGWRIRHRVHEALWQYDAQGTAPHLNTRMLGEQR